ncbi:MAG: transcription-repair coupling factor [Alphaproteobacteria bacterium]|nr:transcription-repair coupling factor [Alphaproteobacteria bacterium]
MSISFNNCNKKTLSSVVKDAEAFAVIDLFKNSNRDLLCILSDGISLKQVSETISFIAPDIEVLTFPNWDTVPYDRVSPNASILSQRIETLAKLSLENCCKKNRIVITSVGAVLQKLPLKKIFLNSRKTIKVGDKLLFDDFIHYVSINGYNRVEQVMESGEYAIRGDIIDIFPSGADKPLRIDLFDDEVERLRLFEVETQRSASELSFYNFDSANEVILDKNTIKSFRSKYREAFGSNGIKDEIYESISQGKRYIGMENWLPFFYDESLPSLFDYIPNANIVLGIDVENALKSKIEIIIDHYKERLEAVNLKDNTEIDKYRPVEPNLMFLEESEFKSKISERNFVYLSNLSIPETTDIISYNTIPQKNYASLKNINTLQIYNELKNDLYNNNQKKKIICCYSKGSLDRMYNLFVENNFKNLHISPTFADAVKMSKKGCIVFVILELQHGFNSDDFFIITEQDIWGERRNLRTTKKVSAENLIADISSLNVGEYVVHIEHGIGRFMGLENIITDNIAHDCLKLIYANNDRLFVPVENIDVISRYSAEDAEVTLDILGGHQWQAKKAKVKEKIKDIAQKLIKIAAERQMKKADIFIPEKGLYEEFCSRFLYSETEDQIKAINDVNKDLSLGIPMDRLICGDVGFGKTEVAIRASFNVAMGGAQVALIVPTTLLARQHYLNFKERLKGYPVKVKMLSRLATPKQLKEIKEELKNGSLEIVIGTHALLANDINFANLGLLIIDEEQHFGVKHKEKLKQLKSDVHILTLSATPIPRTLQLSLTGVKQLSIIATPPVDRLAARTFVTPFDKMMIKEAIYREKYRGGQVFFVCPRISDIIEIEPKLKEIAPDAKILVAHGQMGASQLEDVMSQFAEGKADILLSTTIIESGIDIPNVNTMIIYRSHLFGLAQLYQLKGRIGRSKQRGYCYFTIPNQKKLPAIAQKRLNILQSLNQLGAGFSLANYDLDIRGSGNILGIEQSGHIKDIGIALYHHLLEEEINRLKSMDKEDNSENYQINNTKDYSVQIITGVPIIIPEKYIQDLGVRLGLYKRIGSLKTNEEINDIKEELIDRFGDIPNEVNNLLKTVEIKQLAKLSNIERIEAGARGILISFYNNQFKNVENLMDFIKKQCGIVKIRPDQKLFIERDLSNHQTRLDVIKKYVSKIYELSI